MRILHQPDETVKNKHMKTTETNSSSVMNGQTLAIRMIIRAVSLICILMVFAGHAKSQTSIFQFTFENVLTPVVDNAQGTPSFTSNGVGGLNFNATTPCEGATMYQGSYWSIGDYYQFTVNTTGYTSLSLSYCERISNVLLGTFQIRVSTDGTNWTIVVPDYTPSLTNVTTTTPVFPVNCENTPVLYIQIYKTSAATSTGQSLRIDNAVLTGTPETIPPLASFIPANGETDVLVNVNPTITFNEPVRKTDGTPLTNSDLSTLVSFKTTNASGTDVPFNASIDVTSSIITVTPVNLLNFNQLYYIAVGPVEDGMGNESGLQSAIFTTMNNTTSNDATLSDLQVNGTTVSGFTPSNFIYTYELPYGTTVVPTVTATPNFGLATVNITPAASLPGNTVVLVTAQDGTTQLSYTISFTLALPSTDANLSNLRWMPSTGSQSIHVTGFIASTMNYNVGIPAEVNALNLVASAVHPAATLLITPPANLSGTLADRTGTVQVTAQDGITTQTYSVVFSRNTGLAYHFKEGFSNAFPPAPANWAYSGNISNSTSHGVGIFSSTVSCLKFKWTSPLDGGTLITPVCNTAGTLEFYVRVLDADPSHELHLYVEKSADNGANWTIIATDPMPMNASTVIWHQVIIPVNDNSSGVQLRLRGTANTGTTSLGLFYVDDISLTMNPTTDASLSNLLVNGSTVNGFSPSVYIYNITLPAGTVTIPTVTATAAQPAATVSISDAGSLPGQASVLVTAPDGITTLSYFINFSVELSAPLNLTAALVADNQVDLNWSDINTNEDGFRIERKPNDGLFAPIATVGANVLEYSDSFETLDPDLYVPANRFTTVNVTSGVKFADVTNYQGIPTSLYLDVYEPSGDATLGRPVIIWIHGGGFRLDSYRTQGYIVDYCNRFAKRGYVCVSIDYRLRAAADMPTQASEFPAMQDAARDANAAISWIKANATLYNIDPNLIFIAGGSAGGRTAQTVCQFDGPDPTAIYPPENQYISTPWNKTGLVANATLWGGLEPEMRGWVYPYLQSTDIPTVLVHGDADVTILPQYSIDLKNALDVAGVTNELHIIPGATHSCIGYETQISEWLAAFFAQEWNKFNAQPKSYTYRVCAYNNSGYSPYSNEVTANKTLGLTVFLEGLYNGNGTMRKAMSDAGPQFPGSVADQVTIELHDGSDYSNIIQVFNNIDLNQDGTITKMIPSTQSGDYYVTIVHRNSITTTTAQPVSFSADNISYSFDSSSKAYGNNMIQMIDGNYAIYGGDVNQDGFVDTGDVTPVDNDQFNFMSGYVLTDANGDGSVDTGDITIIDNNQFNFVGTVNP